MGDVIAAEPRFLSYKERLIAQVSRMGIETNFHFVGVRRDVVNVYALTDVFVLSSVFDVFPTAVLEAMAMELPVVATRVGGVVEQVSDGETGFLVPAADPVALADRILALLADPVRARQMGMAARQRVLAHFTAAQYALRTLALYCEVLHLPMSDLLNEALSGQAHATSPI